MTTENGIPTYKQVESYIRILRSRLEWVEDKQAERIDDRLQESGYFSAEINALRWVLTVAEAERDHLLRLRLLIRADEQIAGPASRRVRSLEKAERKRLSGQEEA